MMSCSKRGGQRGTPLKRCLEVGLLWLVACLFAGPVLAWSCASDDTLAAEVTAEERARISAAVARQRAKADAAACAAAGRNDCPEIPDPPQSAILPAGG